MAEVLDAEDLQFRLLAENLPTPCWIAEASGHVIWFNAAWVAYTGMTVADIGQRGGLKALHDPAVYPQVESRWREALASGEGAEMTFPLLGRDGAFRPFHTRVVALRDATGKVFRWFGVNTDVSAQAAVEARLATSQEQWRELFEAAGDAIFITGPDSRYVEVNPAACVLLGYTRDELLALSVADVVAPAEQERHATWRESRATSAAQGEWRLKRKDGSLVDVEVNARPLGGGRFLGIARDVGEQVRERQALRRQVGDEAARRAAAERQRQTFWDVSRDLFAIIAQDGKPRMLNERAWVETLGFPASELMQTRLLDLVHPDDKDKTLGLATPLVDREAVFGFENRYRTAAGAWIWLSWNVIRDGDLTFAVARDVTEEKARAQFAERSQRLEALGQLTGGVAHDFNNLLMTIIGALDVLQRRGDQPAIRERLMTAALAAARRGERLNRQLLTFARRQSGETEVSDLNRLIEEARPLLDGAMRDAVRLELSLDADLAPCSADAAALEAALLNLVVNARDAMPDGGVVTIRTRAAEPGELARYSLAGGAYAVLEVSDTGEGMSPQVASRAFEPFFTTKPIGEGSGLGLAQVYGFARQSGGAAILQSEPGRGTCVKVFLRTASAEARRPQPRAPAPRATPTRVLLVEDDILVGVVTETMLADDGWRVVRATRADEALSLLDDGIDLLLTDVRMPGTMNGAQLAHEAVRRRPGLKVVLCSGWTKEALGADAIAAWPFLRKPFDTEQLRAAIAETGE